MIDKQMQRQIIMDHYKNPVNKVSTDVENYMKLEALNPSCGDEIRIYLKIENDIITDIKFDGSGCSICCASASIMTQELKLLNKIEVLNKINNFYKIIKNGEKQSLDNFEDAQAFIGITDFPARFKCAYLAWDTLKKIIEEE